MLPIELVVRARRLQLAVAVQRVLLVHLHAARADECEASKKRATVSSTWFRNYRLLLTLGAAR
jgi:hypothetical protein